MPSIIPSYMYMIAAMTAVGTILVFSVNFYAVTLRSLPETQRLSSLLDYVAGKAIELLTLTNVESMTISSLALPTSIGNRQYWIRLDNDSLCSWVEGGFGELGEYSSDHKTFLPAHPQVSGQYSSGSGVAVLVCSFNISVLRLTLDIAR